MINLPRHVPNSQAPHPCRIRRVLPMIPGLDGIRGLAFVLVFFLHTDYIYFGWVGVQLFFVLSGFLITNILLRMKENLNVGDYFKKFYGRRFLLIYLVVREKLFLRILDNKFLSYLGKISYGLYIYHFAIVWFVRRVRDLSISEPIAKPLTLVISAVLVYFVASISYKYFEKPILDLKDRWFPLRAE
jgi:peptidoglycan/LPS O-acetylase OafA/YrhL